jgi:hypothetical protein
MLDRAGSFLGAEVEYAVKEEDSTHAVSVLKKTDTSGRFLMNRSQIVNAAVASPARPATNSTPSMSHSSATDASSPDFAATVSKV